MMKNKILTALSILILVSSIAPNAYAKSHDLAFNGVMQQKGYSVHAINSGRASLSKVSVTQRKKGYVVTGNVHVKTMQRRILRIPGSITVCLKDSKGVVLETVTARLHRKFGMSKAAHFEATLKTVPPAGSSIIVSHN